MATENRTAMVIERAVKSNGTLFFLADTDSCTFA